MVSDCVFRRRFGVCVGNCSKGLAGCVDFDFGLRLNSGVKDCVGKKVICVSNAMKEVGSVWLVKKKDAAADAAKGIKVYPLKDKRADFSKPAVLIWKNDLEDLLSGKRQFISAFESLPQKA